MKRHVWFYGRGHWFGPPALIGSDEFFRRTLAIRLPGHRAVVFGLWRCYCVDCQFCRDEALATAQIMAGETRTFATADEAIAYLMADDELDA